MPYRYVDDSVTSDVTFDAWGDSLEELFTAAADATANVMVASLNSIHQHVTRTASVSADALDLLLMRFLDELIFLKDAEHLILRVAEVRVDAGQKKAWARLAGEPIDGEKHELVADVKAVTLWGLQVQQAASGWRARVTLDV